MKQSAIERLLPAVFQQAALPGTPLDAILRVMEVLHEPSENVLNTIERYFNPYQTRAEFAPYLARWVDLERFLVPAASVPGGAVEPSSGVGRLRELVANSAYLAKWRGTARGLVSFLEVATGEKGFVVEEQPLDDQGQPRSCHIRVLAPASAAPHSLLIHKIVESEKPAYVTHEVVIPEATPRAEDAGSS